MSNLRKIAATVVNSLPQGVQISLRGKRGAPSRLANWVHIVLNRLPGQRYMILDCSEPLEGYRMRLDWKKDRSLAYGTWEPEVVQATSKSVLPGMTALDIGAYAGFFTLLLSKLVGSKGKVVSFEPLPANFRVLEENLKLNSIQNVVLEKQAVSSNPGQISLEVPSLESSLLAGPFEDDDERGSMLVPSTSLDDYVFRNEMRVDFIKIDVEGFEDEVLIGAERTLDTFHPIMIIELHNLDNERGVHPAVDDLKKFGYRLRGLSDALYTTHMLADMPAQLRVEGH
jgi:FkbM family methyltransferase